MGGMAPESADVTAQGKPMVYSKKN
jgi:hypothetical protein